MGEGIRGVDGTCTIGNERRQLEKEIRGDRSNMEERFGGDRCGGMRLEGGTGGVGNEWGGGDKSGG